MMAYDYRSATGRADMPPKKLPKTGCAVIVAIFVTALFVGIALLGLRDKTPPETETYESVQRHDSLAPSYTYDGKVIRWYVFIDPDTSVQYLVNDRGGCTPRLDRYGEPIGKMVRETD